jgi:hypothetical protein
MNDMIPAPGAGHVLGLGLVLVLQRILRLRIAAWEVDRESVGAVAQLPAAARPVPSGSGLTELPMHARQRTLPPDPQKRSNRGRNT